MQYLALFLSIDYSAQILAAHDPAQTEKQVGIHPIDSAQEATAVLHFCLWDSPKISRSFLLDQTPCFAAIQKNRNFTSIGWKIPKKDPELIILQASDPTS